jgi:hypothetical protein
MNYTNWLSNIRTNKMKHGNKGKSCKKTKKALQVQGRSGGPTKMYIGDPMKLHKGKYKGERSY